MTLYNWIRLLVTLGLVLLLFLCSAGIFGRRAATGAVTAPGASITAPITTGFAITEPLASAQLAAGGFTLKGTGTPGEQLSIFEDGTNLGSTVVREDGSWAYDVPGPSAGDHTYEARGSGDPATVSVNIAQAEARTEIGTKDLGLDNTCEWSYQSNPGPGAITYEVQELGGGATLSTVNLNIQ